MIMVESKPESDRITFTLAKTRDRRNDRFAARIRFEDERDGLATRVWLDHAESGARLSAAAKWVMGYLAEKHMVTMRDIQGAGKHSEVCTENTAKAGVYELINAGYAKRAPGDKSQLSSYVHYTLTDAGYAEWEKDKTSENTTVRAGSD